MKFFTLIMPFTLINNILSLITKFQLLIQLMLKSVLTHPTCTYKLATMTPLKRTFFLKVALTAHLLSQKKSFILTTVFKMFFITNQTLFPHSLQKAHFFTLFSTKTTYCTSYLRPHSHRYIHYTSIALAHY